MSYDLYFWKQPRDFALAPQAVCERLSDGEQVDGLAALPIEEMIQRIADAFSDWQRLDDATWDSPAGAFQLFTTRQFLGVYCYGMQNEDMNKVIEIAAKFDCPLYDPQVGRRFDLG